MATGAALEPQQHQAAQHQHTGEHIGRRAVVGGLVLVHDGGGEGVKANHHKQAVLGQQMQAHQQGAAPDGQFELGQNHPHIHRPGAPTERGGGVFQGRVKSAHGGGYGQVQKGEIGQHRHQHSATQPVQPRYHRDPSVAVHKGRHGQGGCGQPSPGARPGQVTALGQPRQGQGQHGGQRHGDAYQPEGVDQQFGHTRPKHQRQHGLPAGLHRDPQHKTERQQRQYRHRQRSRSHPGHAGEGRCAGIHGQGNRRKGGR